jgi:ABC-type antimicrobial peptide transport system permease subunit
MALIRQFVAESAVLASAGAIVAVFVARGLGSLLLYAMSSGGNGPDLVLSTDWRVFCLPLSWRRRHASLRHGACYSSDAHQCHVGHEVGGKGATAGHERLLIQRLMVASQIAMAVVMLVAALLFVGSFRNLMTVNTGMRHEGISLAAIRFPESIRAGSVR